MKGFLHKNFDPNVAWIIDPYHVNAIDLNVTVHITCSATKAAVHRMSVVHQLRYLPGILGTAIICWMISMCTAMMSRRMEVVEPERGWATRV